MSVADILREMGEVAARRHLARGQVLGGAIAGAAQIPAQILADRDAQRVRAVADARQAEQLGFQRSAQQRADTDQAAQVKANAAKQHDDAIAHEVIKAYTGGTPNDPDTNSLAAGKARARELDAAEWIPKLEAMDAVQRASKQPKITQTNPAFDTRSDGVITTPAVPKPVAPPKPPEIGSFADYLTRVAADKGIDPSHITPADVEAARKAYQQADDRPRITVTTGGGAAGGDNVKDAVAGMKDGTLPPQMPGRASKDYTAILAESRRQGFDLGKANLDWNATQKHVATMNGAQQLRLNQAINALPDMLDNVDALAAKWKGGKFPILNKANLALAKGGAYGQDVASIATQLDAQIADVTADLGNVYMGGNSPTDHALGLAGKSLKGEWSEQVLHDMVKLAKTNVTIRRNSIANTGVAGASAGNPYAPPPPPAKRIVYDMNGNVVK